MHTIATKAPKRSGLLEKADNLFDGPNMIGYSCFHRTFGINGIAVADFLGAGDIGQAVMIQPDRGIVVGGRADNPRNGTSGCGLARYTMSTLPSATLVPAADTYVRGGAFAGRSFGSTPQLLAKLGVTDDNTRVSYLKFDVRETRIERAVLRVNAHLSNTTSGSITTTVHAVRSVSWDERTLTWNTKPAVGASSDPLGFAARRRSGTTSTSPRTSSLRSAPARASSRWRCRTRRTAAPRSRSRRERRERAVRR